MSNEYPYNGRLSRWEEIAPGLAIVGVQALETPFPFEPGQYATLGLVGRDDHIFSDKLNHASIVDGTKLAYGVVHRYAHGSLKSLERELAHPSTDSDAYVDKWADEYSDEYEDEKA